MNNSRLPTALPWALLACAIVFPWVAEATGFGYYVGFLRRALILAMAAASLNMILGFGGMASLGHAAFFGAGAYTVAVLMAEGVASVWISWPAAVATAAITALAIGAVSLRTRGVYFIMITLAFAQMVYYVAVGLKRYGGEDGLTIMARSTVGAGVDLANDWTFYYLVLALLAIVMLAINRVLDARFGRVLIGIRENAVRMEALGYPVYRYQLFAFTLSGAVAGLAGALFANHNLFVSPASLHWTQSATLLVMVIIGGVGYRYGGVLGAVGLLVLEEVLSLHTEYWHLLLGIVLLLVVFAAPRGLAGILDRGTAR